MVHNVWLKSFKLQQPIVEQLWEMTMSVAAAIICAMAATLLLYALVASCYFCCQVGRICCRRSGHNFVAIDFIHHVGIHTGSEDGFASPTRTNPWSPATSASSSPWMMPSPGNQNLLPVRRRKPHACTPDSA